MHYTHPYFISPTLDSFNDEEKQYLLNQLYDLKKLNTVKEKEKEKSNLFSKALKLSLLGALGYGSYKLLLDKEPLKISKPKFIKDIPNKADKAINITNKILDTLNIRDELNSFRNKINL